MSETSYKPADEETCSTINIVKFTPEQQQHKTPEQLFLHVSNFMKDKIKTLTKKAQKKNTNQKDIKLLNSAYEAAACLVEIVNKEHDDTFSTLAEMQEHMEEKAMNQKSNVLMKVVREQRNWY